MREATLIFLLIHAIVIIQSPVNNSPPINTIIIRPTGKIHPASVLASPTSAMLCTDTLLLAPPMAIKAPAIIPSRIIFPSGRFAFPAPALILASIASAGVFILLFIVTESSIPSVLLKSALICLNYLLQFQYATIQAPKNQRTATYF